MIGVQIHTVSIAAHYLIVLVLLQFSQFTCILPKQSNQLCHCCCPPNWLCPCPRPSNQLFHCHCGSICLCPHPHLHLSSIPVKSITLSMNSSSCSCSEFVSSSCVRSRSTCQSRQTQSFKQMMTLTKPFGLSDCGVFDSAAFTITGSSPSGCMPSQYMSLTKFPMVTVTFIIGNLNP